MNLNAQMKRNFINQLDAELAAQNGAIIGAATDAIKDEEKATIVLKTNFKDVPALLSRAGSRIYLGDFEGAEEDLNQVEGCPPEAAELRALLMIERGQVAEGTQAAKSFPSVGCKELKFLLDLGLAVPQDRAASEKLKEEGNALFTSGKYDDAIKVYYRSLAQDLGNPKVCNNLASCFINKGDPTKAVRWASRATYHSQARGEPFLRAHIRLGEAYLAIRALNRACEPFKQALRMSKDPNDKSLEITDPQALKVKEDANNHYRKGEWEEAAMKYSLALRQVGSGQQCTAVLYANRAGAYVLKGLAKYEDGIKDAEKAILIAPHYPMGYIRKADFKMLQEDYKTAVDTLQLGLKMCSEGKK